MNDNERYMLTNQQQLTLTLESRADWGTALLKTEQVPWKCENFQAVKTCTELLSAPTQWSTVHQLSSSTGSAVYQSMHRAACRAAKPALRHKSGLTVVFLSVCWGLLNEVSLSPFWHVYPLIDLRSYRSSYGIFLPEIFLEVQRPLIRFFFQKSFWKSSDL